MLLVGLSAAREKILLESPEIVIDLVASSGEAKIPDSLEIEHWVELQRVLFDGMILDGGSDEDRRADAVAPRGGLLLYEDKIIDGAKLVRASDVSRMAEWLAFLPTDIVAQVRALPKRGTSAALFPKSLGAAPADDDEPVRPGGRGRPALPAVAAVQEELGRLTAFYENLRKHGKAVLSIRFRS